MKDSLYVVMIEREIKKVCRVSERESAGERKIERKKEREKAR